MSAGCERFVRGNASAGLALELGLQPYLALTPIHPQPLHDFYGSFGTDAEHVEPGHKLKKRIAYSSLFHPFSYALRPEIAAQHVL